MKSVSVENLHEALEKEAPVLIDVRSAEEFAAGHIPGAKNVPLDRLISLQEAVKNAPKVYLQCRSGMRSGQACGLLQAMGLNQVINVEGGILAWIAAGYSIEK